MDNVLPVVSVVITTHNRTNVACAVIDSLCKNLEYKKLNWIITDDRSDDGHTDKLVQRFKDNRIDDVTVCKTTKDRFGLGASMNNGLNQAFKKSPIVLTTEDDWILEKPLNLAYYVNIINKDDTIAGIRLAALCHARSKKSDDYPDMIEVYSHGVLGSVFNNQVMLRHKRIYDKIGMYRENCSSESTEQDMITRFNMYTEWNKASVLFPGFIKKESLTDESLYFKLVTQDDVKLFEQEIIDNKKLNEVDLGEQGKINKEEEQKEEKKEEQNEEREEEKKNDISTIDKTNNEAFFKIIIPNYNNEKYIAQCLDSILNQSFQDFKIIVVDDLSTDRSYEIVLKYQKLYPSKVFCVKAPHKLHAGGCRNIGLDYPINSKYVWFIDGDDKIIQGSLQKIHQYCSESEFDILLFEKSNNGVKMKSRRFKIDDNIAFSHWNPAWLKIYKNSNIPHFEANLPHAEDTIQFITVLDRNPIIKQVDDIFYWYRHHNNQVTKNGTYKKYTKQFYRLFNELKTKIKNKKLINGINKRISLFNKGQIHY